MKTVWQGVYQRMLKNSDTQEVRFNLISTNFVHARITIAIEKVSAKKIGRNQDFIGDAFIHTRVN
jgi:hypothetical protein